MGSRQTTSSQRLAFGRRGDCRIRVGAEFQFLAAKEKTPPGATARRPLPAALQFDRGTAGSTVAFVHPTDASRRGVQESQGRPLAAAPVSSKAGSHLSVHFRCFFSLLPA